MMKWFDKSTWSVIVPTFLLVFISPSQAAELDCLVKPEMYIDLSSPVNSVMEKIMVNPGDTVKRGQPLAKLEASVEKAKYKLAKLNAKSTSEIKIRKEQLRYAKSYLHRMNGLLADNSVSQYEKDKAETEVALAQIELNKANEKWASAQLNQELARTQLELKTINSPIDGIVVDVYSMAGESVRDRTIMKLAKIDPLMVELIAPTEFFGLIEKGMEVDVYPEQPVNQIVKATVSLVDQLIDPASGSFTVRLLLPNPDDELIGGVNCLARFGFDEPQPTGQAGFNLLDNQELSVIE